LSEGERFWGERERDNSWGKLIERKRIRGRERGERERGRGMSRKERGSERESINRERVRGQET